MPHLSKSDWPWNKKEIKNQNNTMQTACEDQNGSGIPKIKPLKVIQDYPSWRRSMEYSLFHSDHLSLGLQQRLMETMLVEESWKNLNLLKNLNKSSSSRKSADCFGLCSIWWENIACPCNFLKSTSSKSNEHSIQNVCLHLDSLVYVQGID